VNKKKSNKNQVCVTVKNNLKNLIKKVLGNH
jgi:hypothetical protein